MKPDFLEYASWVCLPEEKQRSVLVGAGRLLRQGVMPEAAFWAVALEECEEDFRNFFDLENENNEVVWPLDARNEVGSREFVFRVLLSYKAFVYENALRVARSDVPETVLLEHNPFSFAPGASKECSFCGLSLSQGSVSPEDDGFHSDCRKSWKKFLRSIGVPLKKFAVDMVGPEELDPVDEEDVSEGAAYPSFLDTFMD